MKVALKFVAAMILVMAGVRVLEGAITVQRETSRLEEDVRRDSELMGRVLGKLASEMWREQGRERVERVLPRLNVSGHPIEIRWASLDDATLRGRLGRERIDLVERGEAAMMREEDETRGNLQFTFVPLDIEDANGVIEIRENLAQRSRYLNRAAMREAIAGGMALTAGSGLMLVLGLMVLGHPLMHLRKRIEEIGEGDLERRLDVRGRDEIATVARGLNAACDKLSTAYQRERESAEKRIAAVEQMRHAARLTTLGRLGAGVAHELGTPLNVISSRADMVARDASASAEARRNAESIRTQASRMEQIIRNLLDFARQRRPRRTRCGVQDVIHEARDLIASVGYKSGVRVATDAQRAAECEAEMDPGQMQQALTNIIENAMQVMPEGGEVRIEVESVEAVPPAGVDASPGRYTAIAIIDQGPGIAAHDLEHIFDPFFTTKDVGAGTGLGLSIAYGIVQEHAGWIEVSSTVGEGSRFTVLLPHAEPEA